MLLLCSNSAQGCPFCIVRCLVGLSQTQVSARAGTPKLEEKNSGDHVHNAKDESDGDFHVGEPVMILGHVWKRERGVAPLRAREIANNDVQHFWYPPCPAAEAPLEQQR